MVKKHLAGVVRVALAAALVGWLIHHTGPRNIADTIRQANIRPLIAAFAMMFLYSGLKIWNWHLLLVALGIHRPGQLRGVFVCYMTSSLFGTVVPSTMGTDAIRAVLARRRFGGELSRYVASVVVLNALSWMAACTLGLIAIVGLSFYGEVPRIGMVAAPLFCAVIGGGVAAHVLLKTRRGWWLAFLKLIPRALLRFRRPARRLADHLLVFERAHVRFGPIFLAAILAQLGFALTLFFIGRSLNIQLNFLFWPIYGPLVSLVAVIPASVSGFGAEQAAYVYFMAMVGVDKDQAFVASALLSTLNLIFNTVLGSIVFVASGSKDPTRDGQNTNR